MDGDEDEDFMREVGRGDDEACMYVRGRRTSLGRGGWRRR